MCPLSINISYLSFCWRPLVELSSLIKAISVRPLSHSMSILSSSVPRARYTKTRTHGIRLMLICPKQFQISGRVFSRLWVYMGFGKGDRNTFLYRPKHAKDWQLSLGQVELYINITFESTQSISNIYLVSQPAGNTLFFCFCLSRT